ncbi:uncharacterized protein LOC119670360 [Teleopsis dalmanni]|uniref:uncharacterized protein LOC119670360 n=1 Tax=Teleopsis dalmanni TaxID=139649 RepID=UPI0018CDBF52|nr:uncharacterized protein LOC119670360 [Teleopsis dalmanni]
MLQEDSLQQNMLLSKAATQNSNNSVLNKNLNKNINTQQSINKLSANKTCANKVISYSNDSSMLTVSNSNNTHTNTKTHTNTNKISIDQNQIQHQQQNSKPQQTTNEPTTPTVVSNSSISNDLVSTTSSNTNQVNRLGVPQIEDSGTESGEDLRLIAAGLRDKLNMQTDTDLIEEVTTALSRLESSLKEGKDIPVDSNKRNALLALVARLQTGLTSPDKLADAALAATEINGGDINFEETSSPEADAHRSNRQRFAKRRNRNSRHTVGVSREELADARRYMEDMLIIDNISNCTTPESNLAPVTPPQWFPIEKNSSTGSISNQQPQLSLYRPNQFVPNNIKNSTECLGTFKNPVDLRKNTTNVRRPLSGDYSVSFQQLNTNAVINPMYTANPTTNQNGSSRASDNVSPDSAQKSNRFASKKTLYKRANTIDIPKTKKYNADLDTDSEMEDRGPGFGLKRTVQVNVKQKVRSVVPPFEPKTENDHKFLAFINKQSPKPGLGWNNSRSVTNWTNKFGNIKHTFEVGAAATATTGKPPQAPGHVPQNVAKNYFNKQLNQNQDRHQAHNAQMNYQNQKNQQEYIERQRRAEREYLERERIEQERERIEKDRLERQRLEKERQNRDRLEREFYERERQERERLAAEQHAAMPSMTVPKPSPVNKFIHAPQSVFRPIDNDLHQQNVIRPIPKMPNNGNVWQPPSQSMNSPQLSTTKNYSNVSYANSAPSTPSPGALPWVSKPTVDNSIFKIRANKFEEQSLKDDRNNTYLQRHNSLRSTKAQQQPMDDYRKRPSLPNTTDPYLGLQSQYVPNQFNNNYQQPPPPTNISFTYADLRSKSNYQSYPCLPSAVNMALENPRPREDSLTNPEAVPLVLTSLNPSYSPQTDNLQPYSTIPQKQSDFVGSMDSAHTSPSILTMPTLDYTDDDLDSDNMMEYRAETRVMRKPQSQTAVTIGSRQAHVSDDEVFGKNSRAARNLLHTMKSIGNNNNNGKRVQKETIKKPDPPSSPKICLSPDGRSYQAPVVEPLFPDVTNFEAKRIPVYDNTQKPTIQQNKLPENSRKKSKTEKEYDYNSSLHSGSHFTNNQQQSYQSTIQTAYVNDTQPGYIVTYPTDDVSDFEDNSYAKQQQHTASQHRNRHISENSTTSSSMTYSTPSSNINWTSNPIHTDESSVMQKNYINPTEYLNMNTHYSQNSQPPSTNILNSPRNDVRDIKPNVAPKPQIPPLNLPSQEYLSQQRLSQPEIVTKPQPRGMENSMSQQTQYSSQYSTQNQNQYSPQTPQTPPTNQQILKQNQYVPQVQPQLMSTQSSYSPQAQPLNQQMSTQNIYSPQAQPLVQPIMPTESNYSHQPQSYTQQIPTHNNYSPQMQPLAQQMSPQYSYPTQVPPIAQQMPAQNNYLPQTQPISTQQSNQNEHSSQIQSIPRQMPSQDQYLTQAQTISQQITTQKQHTTQAQPINQQKPQQERQSKSQKQLPHVSQSQHLGGQNVQPLSGKQSQPQTQPQQYKQSTQTVSTVKPQPKLSIYQPQQYNHKSVDSKKLISETTSKTQSVVKIQKTKPQAPLLRQSTYTDGIIPLQAQDRVLSQQSLAIKQQQQIQQQQITEVRRKSLGNVLDMQQQQRKSAYFETQKDIKQEYKSSAPADTPDIVKSSLPKEDMPILKKFGPPQRHHYMPNAYQSPSGGTTTSSISSTQTKKYEPNGTVVNTTRKEVVHHSTFTNKPAIVEIPATPQPNEDLIPRNIVFNNVSAFSSMSRRCEEERAMEYQPQTRPNRLSKSDSWNQIVQMQNQQVTSPTSPKFNTSGNELRRTRSGHSLAVPKMFEAGMDKAEISEKQKTVAAYFTGKKSPSNVASEEQEQVTIRKSAINRTKTSEKVSASRKSLSSATANSFMIGGGLSRSATMPHIANLNLLDETNVEDAFEQLMMGS